jgi:hypothetical protein
MCPQFTNGAGSGVAELAVAAVQNLGYILSCVSWVNLWFYSAMCGLRECAKHDKGCGYFSARFFA